MVTINFVPHDEGDRVAVQALTRAAGRDVDVGLDRDLLALGVVVVLGSLIAFRVLQGAGGGLLMPVGQAMLAQAAGPRRIGRVMSLVGVPMLLGPIFGPVIGGAIVDQVSWRWIFFVNLPIGLLAVVLAL